MVNEWIQQNKMKVNAEKSVVISYTRKVDWFCYPFEIAGKVIPRKNVVRDLGVLFDRGLTFRPHIEKIVCECNRILGLLRRFMYEFRSWEPLRLLIVALVRSSILYASTVWAACSVFLINKMEGVQRRFVVSIYKRYFSHRKYNYESLLAELKLLSVRHSLMLRDALLVYDLVNGRIASPCLLSRLNFLVS